MFKDCNEVLQDFWRRKKTYKEFQGSSKPVLNIQIYWLVRPALKPHK